MVGLLTRSYAGQADCPFAAGIFSIPGFEFLMQTFEIQIEAAGVTSRHSEESVLVFAPSDYQWLVARNFRGSGIEGVVQ